VAVFLRNQTGEFEIRKDNIQTRRSTGLSLMPTGFEALGADSLRDLITYLCADDLRFRILDLTPAFTANTSRGIYNSEEARDESLRFRKFGTIKVGDVPFDIVSPTRSPNGNNVIVLKGGAGFARTRPQKVEITAGVAARRLHFLGGIGGWAYPWGGDAMKDKPAVKVTLHFAGGNTEEILLKNGVEIADYIGRFDVPGSKEVPDLVQRGQVRWFTREVKGRGVIDRLALESFNNEIAPTFVGITAELAESSLPTSSASSAVLRPSVAPAGALAPSRTAGERAGVRGQSHDTLQVSAPAGSPGLPALAVRGKFEEGALAQASSPASRSARDRGPSSKTEVLIVGGGTHHDFDRWFNEEDVKTLSAGGRSSVRYTDKPSEILAALRNLDVLYLSNNQAIPDAATRQAIFDFADSGKGLLLVHPALWYNWNDWPEYNRVLVGGGSKSHDKYGEFEVRVDAPRHPIMAGVPDSFNITDELYHHQPDKDGTPAQVLATGRNLADGKTYPVVWIAKHPKARIVCITLGHDGKAHEHPAFKTLLQNSLKWAAGK
jgi:type 1 glutamine amidotransferase